MKANEVAEHILAKINEIVQSGELENTAPAPMPEGMTGYTTTTVQGEARDRLKVYCDALSAVERYSAVEPQPRQARGAIAGNARTFPQ